MKIRKILIIAGALMISASMMFGCGNKKADELNTYKASLENIYNQINTTAVSINNIDVNSEAPEASLLKYIDDMKIEIASLAALNAPEGYEQVTGLAQEALSSITQSSTLYHQIYDEPGYINYDETKAGQAFNFYTYSIGKLNSIGIFLYGETPSGNTVSGQSVSGN